MAQCSSVKHGQWQGNMTIIVINQGIVQSISILSAVICTMIKCDVHKPQDCFHQEAMWMLAIRSQPSTLSALDLDRVHHFPHAVSEEKDTFCQPEGIQPIPNALH
jgi:hypothetical protein